MTEPKALRDLTRGVPVAELAGDAIVRGKVANDEVIVVQRGQEVFAVGAHCTHYKGPLSDGLIVDDTVRCPWHHACFSLRTGEAVRAPALDSIACWRTERVGDQVFVRDKLPDHAAAHPTPKSGSWPESVVIVGGGAAGLAAADMLRREGYDRPITMLSADDAPPCDRPNLSKDYLAGTAEEDWMALRAPEFYDEQHIELVTRADVATIDVSSRTVRVKDGRSWQFGALLIATGAEPVRLSVPGADAAHVHYLRSFSDSKAIIAKIPGTKRAVVVGASFIGLEVAASLRARELEVHVVAPEQVPMERILGPEVGAFIRQLHESHGVLFHLGRTVARVEPSRVILDSGEALDAGLVVVGIGVRPRIDLAEQAHLKTDRGVVVDEYLETSAKGVFAAGDIARWLDRYSGERIRVEHWVVAERQGQAAARNILGQKTPFHAVPFFWSQHYDVSINYVGHAEKWDAATVDGTLEGNDCTVTYRIGDRTAAVATIFRDRESLEAEVAMEKGDPFGRDRAGA